MPSAGTWNRVDWGLLVQERNSTTAKLRNLLSAHVETLQKKKKKKKKSRFSGHITCVYTSIDARPKRYTNIIIHTQGYKLGVYRHTY